MRHAELPATEAREGKAELDGDVRPSELVGNMIEVQTPCRKHVIYYPSFLAHRAIHEKNYSVFQTTCECGTAYIVALQDDGAHFRMGGKMVAISQKYEAIRWPERSNADANGVFIWKEAPSHDALLKYFMSKPNPPS